MRQQSLLAAAATLAVAATYYYYYWRRRKKRQPCIIQSALETAELSVPFDESSPIYNSLNRGQSHASSVLRVQYHTPATFEALDVRLFQRDVAKGCIDPDILGTDAGRDWASVEVLCGSEWRRLRLPAFLAHLANPLAMFEPEIDEATIIPLCAPNTQSTLNGSPFLPLPHVPAAHLHFSSQLERPSPPIPDEDGTFTGTLVWDSAIHTSELMLASGGWAEQLRGATVLELGCGLGLPGWCAHLLGARWASRSSCPMLRRIEVAACAPPLLPLCLSAHLSLRKRCLS